MVCCECGSRIADTSKYCPYCGTSLSNLSHQRLRVMMKCSSCGGTMMIAADKQVLLCPYCGSAEVLLESDDVQKERIWSEAEIQINGRAQQIYKEIMMEDIRARQTTQLAISQSEEESRRLEAENTRQAILLEKQRLRHEALERHKESFLEFIHERRIAREERLELERMRREEEERKRRRKSGCCLISFLLLPFALIFAPFKLLRSIFKR